MKPSASPIISASPGHAVYERPERGNVLHGVVFHDDPTQLAAVVTEPQPVTFHLFSYLLGALTTLVLVGGTLLLTRRPDPPPIALHAPPTPAATATPLPTATPAPMTVFVSGAVQQPGLYALPAGARVGDAIAAAGGLTNAANPTIVNQAEQIWDGAQVHVPSQSVEPLVQQPPAGVSSSGAAPTTNNSGAISGSAGGLININTATAAQLESLPGIGASKAADIIAGRPYATVDDLDRVSGIGAKTLEQLRTLVTTQ